MTTGCGTGEYGWVASDMGKYWVRLIGWLVVKHPASGSLVDSSMASLSVEESGLVRMDELSLVTLALRDPRVM